MSTPHLDTRIIEGRRELVFGPFAGVTTTFGRHGSWRDLPGSVHPHNLPTLLAGAAKNAGLVRTLAGQLLSGERGRLKGLRAFVPGAEPADWEAITAGVRVQLIDRGGTVRFGTRLITSADGSLGALLGASPGASTAVSIMLELLTRCFPDRLPQWERTLRSIVRSYRADPSEAFTDHLVSRQETARILGLAPAGQDT